ncbi:hypothetical protein JI664_12605 [Rhodobacter sp. NTK016B]|uniref:hypothetical protein n=1 Tax=Rhodobacter sp. NTK016B TaxID=2759676 RepID=UPI001A8D372C|nr:hypothetical protein [Rhodobacter sp. NTK016B]MBN8292807.1 hypothetical protein [Rhodobacter sp. NTK016B]
MLRDADFRYAPAVVQSFKAGSVVNIPRATAQTLIASGAAKQVPTKAAKENENG